MPPLSTGTAEPTGLTIDQEPIYIEGSPDVWFQDAAAPLAKNPDAGGFYWGLSGTATYPTYEFGCIDDFSMVDDVTANPVTCSNLGEVDEMQRRNHIDLTFTLKSLLPFDILSRVLRGGAVTVDATEETEKFGLGEIRSQLYHFFFSRVYDVDAGDYLSATFPRCRFVEASPLETPYAEPWNIAVTVRAFADSTKPRAQRFGTFLRLDPDQIP